MNNADYHMDQSKQCLSCGNTFYRHRKYGPAYWSRAKFCSPKCGVKYMHIDNRPSLEEKFWLNVSKGDGCWEWTWLKDKDGYGLMPYARKLYRAHVVALMIDGRPVTPDNPVACHHCDNPACVRPSHLYPGTHKSNVADMLARGRARLGEQNYGSKLTLEQVLEIRSSAESVGSLAKRFNVTHGAVSMARAGKTWKHVNDKGVNNTSDNSRQRHDMPMGSTGSSWNTGRIEGTEKNAATVGQNVGNAH